MKLLYITIILLVTASCFNNGMDDFIGFERTGFTEADSTILQKNVLQKLSVKVRYRYKNDYWVGYYGLKKNLLISLKLTNKDSVDFTQIFPVDFRTESLQNYYKQYRITGADGIKIQEVSPRGFNLGNRISILGKGEIKVERHEKYLRIKGWIANFGFNQKNNEGVLTINPRSELKSSDWKYYDTDIVIVKRNHDLLLYCLLCEAKLKTNIKQVVKL